MIRQILLNSGFLAVTEDGRLVEYLPVNPEDRFGDILTGKVDRLMPGLKCAFVDIGRKKNGFLPLQENSKTFDGAPLRSGDRIPVQIRKEENGEKGAFLSRDLTVTGRNVILMPKNRHIGVSARITAEAERERLCRIGERVSDGRFGLVLRSAAAEVPEEEIGLEAESLFRRWETVSRQGLSGGEPGRVLLSGNTGEESLRNDYLPRGVTEFVHVEELNADLRRQLNQGIGRKVMLPHGGNIVIDPCEAMTVIDVNSASDTASADKRATVLRTNLEACEEIMIQVRLRNLSGILILDMIDMEDETDRSTVLETLGKMFGRDRNKTVIHGWTSLGLIEMTRKRNRPPLRDLLAGRTDKSGDEETQNGESAR